MIIQEERTSKQLVSSLSLEEQIRLVSGASFWTLPMLPASLDGQEEHEVRVSDGPHGLRVPASTTSIGIGTDEVRPATCFPAACALACSWDVDLLREVGRALADECRHYQVQLLLGPAMNLKRYPSCGRNFEYFSEDPVLSGQLAAAYIHGVQEHDPESSLVGACAKHFCVNNQETNRFVVNVQVDERSLRELYLRGFEIVVTSSSPAAMMGAYNQVNGVYCCEHSQLLQHILRDDWHYQGLCLTDWGATHDRAAAMQSGMDLEMPGNDGANTPEIRQAIQDGRLSRDDLITCASRVVEFQWRFTKAPQKPPSSSTTTKEKQLASDERLFQQHDELARDVARDCIVLLKNENDLLPLTGSHSSMAVIGAFAKESRYQGMGSSHVTAITVHHAWDAIESRFHHDKKSRLLYAPGYNADPYEEDDTAVDQRLLDEAQKVAEQANVVLLFLGLPEIMESEGFDRTHLRLPKQQEQLLQVVATVCSHIVVVLSSGGVLELPPTIAGVSSILHCHLLGQAGGLALADVLFGDASPSGKLAETFPLSQSDILADRFFPGNANVDDEGQYTVEYREGLAVGYRFFDSHERDVLYPFGHGLAYASFYYTDLSVAVEVDLETTKRVVIEFQLQNLGKQEAKEVCQCYVSRKPGTSTVYRPRHQLEGFRKLSLRPGESKTVTMQLSERAFSFYDVGNKQWVVEPGAYAIEIGASSRDIRVAKEVTFQQGQTASKLAQERYPPGKWKTDAESFARRFDERQTTTISASTISSQLIHRNSLVKDVASSSYLGKLFCSILVMASRLQLKRGPSYKRELKMLTANLYSLPLRVLVLCSSGKISFRFLDAFILLLNGQIRKGLVAMFWACCQSGDAVDNPTQSTAMRAEILT